MKLRALRQWADRCLSPKHLFSSDTSISYGAQGPILSASDEAKILAGLLPVSKEFKLSKNIEKRVEQPNDGVSSLTVCSIPVSQFSRLKVFRTHQGKYDDRLEKQKSSFCKPAVNPHIRDVDKSQVMSESPFSRPKSFVNHSPRKVRLTKIVADVARLSSAQQLPFLETSTASGQNGVKGRPSSKSSNFRPKSPSGYKKAKNVYQRKVNTVTDLSSSGQASGPPSLTKYSTDSKSSQPSSRSSCSFRPRSAKSHNSPRQGKCISLRKINTYREKMCSVQQLLLFKSKKTCLTTIGKFHPVTSEPKSLLFNCGNSTLYIANLRRGQPVSKVIQSDPFVKPKCDLRRETTTVLGKPVYEKSKALLFSLNLGDELASKLSLKKSEFFKSNKSTEAGHSEMKKDIQEINTLEQSPVSDLKIEEKQSPVVPVNREDTESVEQESCSVRQLQISKAKMCTEERNRNILKPLPCEDEVKALLQTSPLNQDISELSPCKEESKVTLQKSTSSENKSDLLPCKKESQAFLQRSTSEQTKSELLPCKKESKALLQIFISTQNKSELSSRREEGKVFLKVSPSSSQNKSELLPCQKESKTLLKEATSREQLQFSNTNRNEGKDQETTQSVYSKLETKAYSSKSTQVTHSKLLKSRTTSSGKYQGVSDSSPASSSGRQDVETDMHELTAVRQLHFSELRTDSSKKSPKEVETDVNKSISVKSFHINNSQTEKEIQRSLSDSCSINQEIKINMHTLTPTKQARWQFDMLKKSKDQNNHETPEPQLFIPRNRKDDHENEVLQPLPVNSVDKQAVGIDSNKLSAVKQLHVPKLKTSYSKVRDKILESLLYGHAGKHKIRTVMTTQNQLEQSKRKVTISEKNDKFLECRSISKQKATADSCKVTSSNRLQVSKLKAVDDDEDEKTAKFPSASFFNKQEVKTDVHKLVPLPPSKFSVNDCEKNERISELLPARLPSKQAVEADIHTPRKQSSDSEFKSGNSEKVDKVAESDSKQEAKPDMYELSAVKHLQLSKIKIIEEIPASWAEKQIRARMHETASKDKTDTYKVAIKVEGDTSRVPTEDKTDMCKLFAIKQLELSKLELVSDTIENEMLRPLNPAIGQIAKKKVQESIPVKRLFTSKSKMPVTRRIPNISKRLPVIPPKVQDIKVDSHKRIPEEKSQFHMPERSDTAENRALLNTLTSKHQSTEGKSTLKVPEQKIKEGVQKPVSLKTKPSLKIGSVLTHLGMNRKKPDRKTFKPRVVQNDTFRQTYRQEVNKLISLKDLPFAKPKSSVLYPAYVTKQQSASEFPFRETKVPYNKPTEHTKQSGKSETVLKSLESESPFPSKPLMNSNFIPRIKSQSTLQSFFAKGRASKGIMNPVSKSSTELEKVVLEKSLPAECCLSPKCLEIGDEPTVNTLYTSQQTANCSQSSSREKLKILDFVPKKDKDPLMVAILVLPDQKNMENKNYSETGILVKARRECFFKSKFPRPCIFKKGPKDEFYELSSFPDSPNSTEHRPTETSTVKFCPPNKQKLAFPVYSNMSIPRSKILNPEDSVEVSESQPELSYRRFENKDETTPETAVYDSKLYNARLYLVNDAGSKCTSVLRNLHRRVHGERFKPPFKLLSAKPLVRSEQSYAPQTVNEVTNENGEEDLKADSTSDDTSSDNTSSDSDDSLPPESPETKTRVLSYSPHQVAKQDSPLLPFFNEEKEVTPNKLTFKDVRSKDYEKRLSFRESEAAEREVATKNKEIQPKPNRKPWGTNIYNQTPSLSKVLTIYPTTFSILPSMTIWSTNTKAPSWYRQFKDKVIVKSITKPASGIKNYVYQSQELLTGNNQATRVTYLIEK